MKVTKEQLKEMIKEELKEANRAFGKLRGSDAKRQGIDQARELGRGSGISDAERGIIQALNQQLTSASRLTAINGGTILADIQRLSQKLEKILRNAGAKEEQQ